MAVLAQISPYGFSDGGDGPSDLVPVLAQPAPDGFSDGGDGLMAILVQPTPDGFSDGGNGDGLVQPPLRGTRTPHPALGRSSVRAQPRASVTASSNVSA